MPRLKGSPAGAFSTIGTVRSFVGLVREMSFDEQREQAERHPRILIIAPDDDTGRSISDLMFGAGHSESISIWPLESASRNADAYDVVIVNNPSSNATFRQARAKAGSKAAGVFDLSQASL